MIWALRVGIIFLGGCLVWEQVQIDRQEKGYQRTRQQRRIHHGTARRGKVIQQPQLSDFSATKVEAAKVWLYFKGTRVIDEATPLHIRKIAAGQRIRPDDPASAVYDYQLTQIYSDDLQDATNSVTYKRTANNTVIVIPNRSTQLAQGESNTHDERVIQPLLQTQEITLSAKLSATLLRVVQLII